MSYILLLHHLPILLSARWSCLNAQLSRASGSHGAHLVMQLHELEQLQALLHATVGPLGPLDIPHDALARFTSGQDVLYKCDSPRCPGYAWPVSVRPHPCQAGEGEPGKVAEPSSEAPYSWPCPTTFDQLVFQLKVAAEEQTTYEIDAGKLLKILEGRGTGEPSSPVGEVADV